MTGANVYLSKTLDAMGLGDFANLNSGGVDAKACCAALYELEPVRMLLGDTLHPGGLAMTNRLARLTGVRRGDLVLDVACGHGKGALAVARSFHCRVVGVDLGRRAVAEATLQVAEEDASFILGDAESMPLRDGAFDAALCECSMSLFPDKARGVVEVARLLRPGGRLGISDVTVEPGALPPELSGPIANALCLAGAPPVDGYIDLLREGGLTPIHHEDASDSILKLVDEIEGKLSALRLLQSFGGQASGLDLLAGLAKPVIDKVRVLVRDGSIGYWIFVAEK